jgi:hypothetical protein
MCEMICAIFGFEVVGDNADAVSEFVCGSLAALAHERPGFANVISIGLRSRE